MGRAQQQRAGRIDEVGRVDTNVRRGTVGRRERDERWKYGRTMERNLRRRNRKFEGGEGRDFRLGRRWLGWVRLAVGCACWMGAENEAWTQGLDAPRQRRQETGARRRGRT